MTKTLIGLVGGGGGGGGGGGLKLVWCCKLSLYANEHTVYFQ